ncbi:hypothetical protein GTH32_00400 [Alteromonas sp. 345S023]|uniref:Uncharacterized protein n=1 Tax=Alteromonas profundi TaxID=2696062 RepID=A0A7X5RJC9_9ALTE|nr:hypothetical protein [Alteromonas profundi]NDV89657.1 hypothetical protein [Alteromonas profundi]
MTQQYFQISPLSKAPNSAAPFFMAWLLSFVLFNVAFFAESAKATPSATPLSPAVAFYDIGGALAARFSNIAEKQYGQSDQHGFLPPNRLRLSLSRVLGYFSAFFYTQPAYPIASWKGISKRGPPEFL